MRPGSCRSTRIGFDARIEGHEDGWLLTVAALEAARGEVLFELPRLQLDLRGETMDLRALALPLAPLGKLLAGTEVISPALADLCRRAAAQWQCVRPAA